MSGSVLKKGLTLATATLLAACAPTYKPMGPMTVEPHITADTFVARDGTHLPLTVWGPRENANTVVVAVHSFGEFRDAFALIGEHLAAKNIAVWAFDQRGFGNGPHPGLWSGTDTMVQDFKDFTSTVKDIAGHDTPLVLLGESMGGAVVLASVSDPSTPRPKAVVLSGPGVREDRPNRYWYNAGLWLATRIIPGYEAEVTRPYDARLADYHAQRWASDPKIINQVRLDTYYGLIRLSDFASDTAQNTGVPTLVLYGTEDDQIHPKSICALMARLGDSGTLRVFQDEPHLMFQVRDQEMILNLIERWIESPAPQGESDRFDLCSE